MPAKKIINIT